MGVQPVAGSYGAELILVLCTCVSKHTDRAFLILIFVGYCKVLWCVAQ